MIWSYKCLNHSQSDREGYNWPTYIPLVRISVAVIKHHDQNQVGEERVYFLIQLVTYHPGISGQEFKAGTETEAMEEW